MFPNPETYRRLVTARRKEHDEDWVPGPGYIDLRPLAEDEGPEIEPSLLRRTDRLPSTGEPAQTEVTQES